MQDSRSAVGNELLQLGQVDLTLHGLGLGQCTHMQSDDVFGQHLGGQRGPWVSPQALPSLGTNNEVDRQGAGSRQSQYS